MCLKERARPGVLFFCGHEAEAKATDSYQKTAILFALNGFAVFVIDPIAQGERYQIMDKTGKPATRGGTTEHTLINAAANLVGSGVVAYELWDNLRGLDYLFTRPEIDKDRIGCIGNSGGGTQATYFVGFDERIKVAAICSFVASRERNFDLIGANDGCQHLMNEGKAQLEISDFLTMFAPKPLLVLAGRYDFVDYTGTQQAYEEIKTVYTAFNQPENVLLFTADDGHGISKLKREKAVLWFRKHFYNDTITVQADVLETLPHTELQCTLSGQVNSFYKDELNDIDRTQIIADNFGRNRGNKATDLRTTLETLMSLYKNNNHIIVEKVGQVEKGDYLIHKIILRKESELPVPLLLIYPVKSVKEVVLWLHNEGKHHVADSTALIKNYLSKNAAIIVADLAGMGEMADPEIFNDAKYLNAEYRNAIMALHLGSSLITERVRNINLLFEFISANEKLAMKPIHLYAKGKATMPAIHASVIDERVSKLHLYGMISSFREIFQKPWKKDWYSYIVPGALQFYDIPDLKTFLFEKITIE